MKRKIIIAYIPVIHAGYLHFFEKNNDYDELYILDKTITNQDRVLQKDVRALEPTIVKKSIDSLAIFKDVHIALSTDLMQIKDAMILMPDEDISHDIALNFFSKTPIRFENVFLRWDRKRSNANDPIIATTISKNMTKQKLMMAAWAESKKSSDVWRRVGALLVKDDEEIERAHNHALPFEHSGVHCGDPRASFKKGMEIEKSIYQHAEAELIAKAAKIGSALDGLDMYVTVFPCPPCAKLISASGIKRLFFASGYSTLDSAEILRTQDIEIIQVDIQLPDSAGMTLPYPKK